MLDQSEWVYGYKFKEFAEKEGLLYADLHNTEYIKWAIVLASVFKNVDCTLVTHNSDYSVSMAMPKGIEIPPNLLWYSVNVDVAHPQIRSIPIGLENPEWHPDKTAILEDIMREPEEKYLWFNFICNVATNPSHRSKVGNNFYQIAKNSGKACQVYPGPVINGQDFEAYARTVSSSYLTVCPRGNGIDTHRIWEALYLGSIPLVQDGLNEFSLGICLPLILVDLENVTQIELEETVNRYQKIGLLNDKRALKMSYWIDKIRNRK